MSQRTSKLATLLLTLGIVGYMLSWPLPEGPTRELAGECSGLAVALGFLLKLPEGLRFIIQGPKPQPRGRAPVGHKLSPPGLFVRFRPLLGYSLLLLALAPQLAPKVIPWLLLVTLGIIIYQWLTPAESFERGILAAELAVFLDLGIPLPEAARRLCQESQGRFSTRLSRLPQALADLHWDLEAGALLSGAVSHQDYFPPIWRALARLGERTGKLPETLRSLSKLELRRRTRPAILRLLLTIPLVGLVASLVQSDMLPRFFSSVGIAGDGRVHFWASFWVALSAMGTLVCLVAFLLLFVAVFFPKFTGPGRLMARLERLPLLWPVVRLEQQLAASEAMLTGLRLARPTTELLDYAFLSVNQSSYRGALAAQEAASGSTLSQVLEAHSELFDPEFRALVAQGEAVGELTESLELANDYLADLLHEEEARSYQKLEFILQLTVGFLVAVVALGHWLPVAEIYGYLLSEGLQP